MDKLKNRKDAALFLGACPALAASGAVIPALAMAAETAVILILATLLVSLLKSLLNEKYALPVSVLVTAFLASAASMLTEAYVPEVFSALGIYVAVSAVSMMVVTSGVKSLECTGCALKDSVVLAIRFALLVLLVAVIRELFGSAALCGKPIEALASCRIPVLAKAPGAFMVYSIVLALFSVKKEVA